jgi:5-methylcytosine-specific restriction enzyme subunit McrC
MGTEAFRLKPDIVVMHRSGQTLLIADAKWKLIDADDAAHTISAGDVYQMLAYARRYEVNEVVLIYPAQRDLTPSDAISFQIELDHIRLHAFGLDLVNPHSIGSALFQYLRKFGTQPIQLSA